MRLRKRDLRTRVKPFLPIEFTNDPLTSHAGLELFRRFCERAGWLDRLRAVFAYREFDRDYGSFRVALLVVGLLLLGGSRLSHLRVLDRDLRLRRLPDERTFSRGLQDMIASHQDGLSELLREVTYRTCEEIRLSRATIELDGTVLRTGECVDGAERGFNPHHPKDPSYYPLTAHLAQTGQLLGVWNRPGNVNDSVGAAERLTALIADVRTRLGAIPLEVRLDGAFFQKPVLDVLTASRVEYTVKVPMLGVRERIAARRAWERVNGSVDAFSTRLHIEAWSRTERIVVYRKRVAGETRKNFQLDLFSPDDGHYEYSMVATDKTIGVQALWAFMAGRGGHEKTLGELKQHLAFGCVPTQDWDANSAWQLLSALPHNLVRHLQVQTGAARRPNARKRTCRYRFLSLRTLRFTLFQLPGRIAQPAGRAVLRIAASPTTRHRIREIETALAA